MKSILISPFTSHNIIYCISNMSINAIMPLVITRALTSSKPGYLFGTKIFECKGNKVFIIILLFVKSITSPVLILWDVVTHWAMFLLQFICTHFWIWYRWRLIRQEFNHHWRRLGPKWRRTHILMIKILIKTCEIEMEKLSGNLKGFSYATKHESQHMIPRSISRSYNNKNQRCDN